MLTVLFFIGVTLSLLGASLLAIGIVSDAPTGFAAFVCVGLGGAAFAAHNHLYDKQQKPLS